MSNTISSGSTTTVSLSNGSEYYVPEGVAVSASSGNGITGSATNPSGINLAVDGTVTSFGGSNTIYFHQATVGSAYHHVLIGATGVVRQLDLGYGTSAIWLNGSTNVVENWGEVLGGAGVALSHSDNGVVENHGAISGLASDGNGVAFYFSTDATLVNSGIISGASGVHVQSSNLRIVNSGEIHATRTGYRGIDAASSGFGITVHNTGLISAYDTAIQGGSGDDVVANHGQIDGDVNLGSGSDTYRGGGGMTDGTIMGEGGGDTLKGGAGADDLNGGGGRDTIIGRDGDDTITGGAGADRLKGGAGDDTFVFTHAGQGPTHGKAEHILDFHHHQDVVDLSAIPGHFAFVGAHAFKGGGHASVRVVEHHGNAVVMLDANGDGTMDGKFVVDGTHMHAGDFML